MQPTPTVDDLNRLQREAERLLRGFELDVRQALVAEKDPQGTINTWRAKLDALSKTCAERAKPPTPATAAPVIASIEKETRRRFEDLARRAQRAHERRPQADGKWVRAYDEVVSGGLSKLPAQATNAGRDQIARAIKQLVDGALPAGMVRPEQATSWSQAKQQIATSLTQWVEQQDVVEDAFFVAQSTLLDAAGFLQRQLTIHSQLKELKTQTEQAKTLDAPTAKKVDAQAGALGKAWNQGVQQGEQQVKRAATVRTDLRLEPRFVLDPARRFLSEVNAKAGITIESSQIKIQLAGHVTIVEPLTDQRQLKAGEELSLQRGPWTLSQQLAADRAGTVFGGGLDYTKGNFTGGVRYENDRGNQSVKASITFRF